VGAAENALVSEHHVRARSCSKVQSVDATTTTSTPISGTLRQNGTHAS
jgi:hypothetical protein